MSRTIRRVNAVTGVLISVVLNAASTIVVVRLLGAAGRGEMVALTLVPTITYVVLGFGMPSSNVYHAARDKSIVGRLAANTIALSVVMPILAAGLSLLVPDWVLTLGNIGLPPEEIRLAILLAPALLAFQQLAGVTQGASRYDTVRTGRLVQGVLLLGLLLVVSQTSIRSPFVYFLFWIVSYAAAAAFLAFAIGRESPLRLSLTVMRASMRFGVRAMWTQLWEFVNLRGDQVLVALIGSPTALGLYSLAVSLSEILLHVPNALTMVVFSDTATAEYRRPRRVVRREAGIMFLLIVAAGAVLVAGTWLFAEPILKLSPRQVVPMLAIMAVPVAALASTRMLGGFLMGEGRPELPSIAAGASVAVTFALDVVLVPKLGALGAAIGVSAGYMASSMVMLGTFAVTGRAARDEDDSGSVVT